MIYDGPERRIHRVVITENTEYHLRRRKCLCVRDRHSGQWVPNHRALHKELVGAVSTSSPELDFNGSCIPHMGERMMFDGPMGPVFTTPVIGVERAPKDLVIEVYPPDIAA